MEKDKNILTREKNIAECPHCLTLSHWDWHEFKESCLFDELDKSNYTKISFSQCKNCEQDVLFYKDILVFPIVETKAIDLNGFEKYPNSLKLFNEATAIIDLSPQAALTLAKMCLESLVKEILEDRTIRGSTFLENINTLVEENIIDENIKDIVTDVRIIGNEGDPVFNLIDTSSHVLSEDAVIVLKIVTHIIKTINDLDKLRNDLLSKM